MQYLNMQKIYKNCDSVYLQTFDIF